MVILLLETPLHHISVKFALYLPHGFLVSSEFASSQCLLMDGAHCLGLVDDSVDDAVMEGLLSIVLLREQHHVSESGGVTDPLPDD